MSEEFNGWTNYETFDVALHIANDETLYNLAIDCTGYIDFRDKVIDLKSSPLSGLQYYNGKLNIEELNNLIKQIGESK